MKKDWYVLHVLTGSELEVKRQLSDAEITAVVLQETVAIRSGGKWTDQTRTVFPGYVFVYIELEDIVYYQLKGVTGAIRLLPKGNPMPLEAEDSTRLLYTGEVLPLSKIDFKGKAPRIVNGPLKEWEAYITHIDRHRRRAQLRIPVLGEPKDVTLYIEPV